MDLHSTAGVMTICKQFVGFYVSPEGEVSWQDQYV